MPLKILYLYDLEGGQNPREILCQKFLKKLEQIYDVTHAHGIVPESEIEVLPEDARGQVLTEESVLDEDFRLIFMEGRLRLEEVGRGRRVYADFLRRFIDEGGVVILHLADPFEIWTEPGIIDHNRFLHEAGLPQIDVRGKNTLLVDEYRRSPDDMESVQEEIEELEQSVEDREEVVQTIKQYLREEGYEGDIDQKADSLAANPEEELEEKRQEMEWLRGGWGDPDRQIRVTRPVGGTLIPVSPRFQGCLEDISKLSYSKAARLCVPEDLDPIPIADQVLLVDQWMMHDEVDRTNLRDPGIGAPVLAACREWNHGFGCLITGNICDDIVVEASNSDNLEYMMGLVGDLLDYQQEKLAKPQVQFEDAEEGATVDHLIQKGEGGRLEFKTSAFRDLESKEKNTELMRGVAKAIAAFRNTNGGTVLIGVEEAEGEPRIRGIEWDWKVLGGEEKRHWNFYRRHLMDSLDGYLDDQTMSHIQVGEEHVDNNKLGRIEVPPGEESTYLSDDRGEHFYVRQGDRDMPLTGKEREKYLRKHFWD